MNELEKIVARTRRDVAAREAQVPPDSLQDAVAARRERGDWRAFALALREPGLSVIAEHKRSSPSAGVIREGIALEDVVRAYENAGARALSILTEPTSFGGSLQDLRAARLVTALPILRKDFIVTPYQVVEAVAAGADAILLIVAALADDELSGLHRLATELGLDVLVEVHDEAELDRALAAGAPVIGINNRDLTTLQVDVERTFELLPRLPEGTIAVSESGLRSPEQLDRLLQAGVDAVLIGEALMRAPDIEAACRAMTSRGAL